MARSHFPDSTISLPTVRQAPVSRTASLVRKEILDTDILNRKEAASFAVKICFTDKGLYERVSSVRFSFSPTKETTDITEDDMIGMIREKTGRITADGACLSACPYPAPPEGGHLPAGRSVYISPARSGADAYRGKW